ncbi:DEAD/DEAH box helicase [Streptomyces sp. MZ04]|uniref:DEAD/DEAH box helicase n=1 Tax=Streptomyces sp. MZ04 TaxID=2559236 RepID=UPI00107E888D|nr:DEAD/DEAH box helicase [Streptomyces sp. MZ04]TGB15543.1 helicase [Streptomyces sp. MZ04]
MELWPHQRDASHDVQKGWSRNPRVTCVMPCGTGKTGVGADAAGQIAPAGRRIIAAPTVELLSQQLNEWARVLGTHERLGELTAVCSDPAAMHRDGMDERVLRADVTTDPRQVARSVARSTAATVACTYDSLPVVSEAHRVHGLPPWDVVVADEAHRTVGVRGRLWSTVHDDLLIPAKRRLYMTATPRILGASGRSEDTELVGMNNERVYGPEVHHLSYASAYERGLLAGYQVIVACVTREEVRCLAADFTRRPSTHYQVGSTAMAAPMLARQVAVLRAVAQTGLRRMITYHHRVQDAHWFARTLPQVAEWLDLPLALRTGCVYGSQPFQDRREVLDLLRGGPTSETTVISNARVLAEGVDAPSVDAVAFIDSRDSVVDVVQAVGRALRLGGRAHKTASVIIPVLLDAGQDPEEALAGSTWSPVWRVLRALRAHDERLAAHLDSARRTFGQSESVTRNLHELPDWLHVTGMPVPEYFADAIYTQLVRTSTPAWEEYLGAAQQYHQEHGHLRVTHTQVSGTGLALGRWLGKQRSLRRAGHLLPEREHQLDRLGILWNPMEAHRQEALSAARLFVSREGHLRVPKGHLEEGFPLGTFLQNVRRGEIDLSEEESEQLRSWGFTWKSRYDEYWDEMIRAARKYRDREGNLLVPARHVEPGSPPANLGNWIALTRSKRDELPAERREQLDELGMVWSVYEYDWSLRFGAVEKFHRENGHLKLPVGYTVDIDGEEVDLHAWLRNLRSHYRSNRLKPERASQLEELGMVWNEHDHAWEVMFHAACEYYTREGNLLVPSGHLTDGSPPRNLGNWIAAQRQARLSQDRRSRLAEIGMVWDVQKYHWDRNVRAAQKYFKEYGNLRVPYSFSVAAHDGEIIPLGQWVSAQRSHYKKGKLSVRKVDDLTRVGMEWPRLH